MSVRNDCLRSLTNMLNKTNFAYDAWQMLQSYLQFYTSDKIFQALTMLVNVTCPPLKKANEQICFKYWRYYVLL